MNSSATLPKVIFFTFQTEERSELDAHASALYAENAEQAGQLLREYGDVEAIIVDLSQAGEKLDPLLGLVRNPDDSPAPGMMIVGILNENIPGRLAQYIRRGVDHIFIRPITARGLLREVKAFARHPVRQVKVASYVGPDRRRLPELTFDGDKKRQGDKKRPR